ncbi:hypothetical protein TRVL_04142 [Trypanosoma vivax]|nr:hypothetical protein TRVL_04142 [Trypanosoma vivax]
MRGGIASERVTARKRGVEKHFVEDCTASVTSRVRVADAEAGGTATVRRLFWFVWTLVLSERAAVKKEDAGGEEVGRVGKKRTREYSNCFRRNCEGAQRSVCTKRDRGRKDGRRSA